MRSNILKKPFRWILAVSCMGIAWHAGFFLGVPFSHSLSLEAHDPSMILKVNGESVEITRNLYGVPRVKAHTLYGLFYGNGYAVAQDRMLQMDRFRRDARGTLAEIDGEPAVERDREARRMGYTGKELNLFFQQMPSEDREIFRAYAAGVNAWISKSGMSNPSQDKKALEPWEVSDSIAVAIMMANRFGSGGGQELRNLQILQALIRKTGEKRAREIFDQFLWINDRFAPATLGEVEVQAPAGLPPPAPPVPSAWKSLNPVLLERAAGRAAQAELLQYASRHALPDRFGSYAMVIGPAKSLTGNPMLVGGPQMGFTVPNISHELQLNGAGFNVTGMGFAGVPGVLIGHNETLAWTVTSGLTDLVDVFIEELDPDDPYRYRYQGEYRQMERRIEWINVKGAEALQVEIARTVHGPVLEWDKPAGVAYSYSQTFRKKELETVSAVLGFSRAQTVFEFARHVGQSWLSFNCFAADSKGNIAFWHSGKPPLRADGVDLRLPTPGNGNFEWRGFVEFEQMPQLINPKRQYLVNWNSKPSAAWNHGDTPLWGEVFRAARLEELVQAKPALSAGDLRKILIDIASNDATADGLKKMLLAALENYETSDPDLHRAGKFLKGWDNHSDEESIAKTIFDAWISALRERLFRSELGDALDQRAWDWLLQPSVILHQLKGKSAGAPVQADFLAGRPPGEVMIQSLKDALAVLKEKGQDWSAWGFQPGFIRLDPLPPIPAAQRGSYIQIITVGQPVRGVSILPPGQSGNPQSPHFGDQRELAAYWKFKPMNSAD